MENKNEMKMKNKNACLTCLHLSDVIIITFLQIINEKEIIIIQQTVNIQKCPAVQWTVVLSDCAQHTRQQPLNEPVIS